MSTTISNGTDSVVPDQIDGYETARASRNIVHPIISSNIPAVSLRPAGLRRGTLTALTVERATALALEALLAGSDLLTLDDSDDDTLDMSFIIDGNLTVRLDEETRAAWLVVFDYQEVIV